MLGQEKKLAKISKRKCISPEAGFGLQPFELKHLLVVEETTVQEHANLMVMFTLGCTRVVPTAYGQCEP